jgi:hypothetical protein
LKYLSLFIGAGFPDESVEVAADLDFDFIGADAGSIDVGPCQLGGTGQLFADDLCRRDLRHVLKLARSRGVPLLVGSSGGAGTDGGVDRFAAMVREIAADEDLAPFKLARIYTEVDRAALIAKVKAGRVRPLPGNRFAFDAAAIARSTCIVSVIGAEPFQQALAEGADVILAGRTTDSAIFAALPLARGYAPATAWHAGKVAECGGAVGQPSRSDLLYVQLNGAGFTVTPCSPDAVCTSWSVAAHQLYENADPFYFVEPAGTMSASDARFTEIDNGIVRIEGAQFEPAPAYTRKLEGVEPAGFQSITMGCYNDPVLIEDIGHWQPAVLAEIQKKVARIYGQGARQAIISLQRYGDGGGALMFPKAVQAEADWKPRELFFLLSVNAPEREMASSVCTLAWHTLIHFPPRGWKGSFVTAAWPFNPPVMDRGPVHRFNVDHVEVVDDPCEGLRFRYEEIGR